MKLRFILRFVVLGVGFLALAPAMAGVTDQMLSTQFEKSKQYMLENLENPEVPRGAVIASPSKSDPDYFFHWIRDAALTMNTVLDLFEKSEGPDHSRLETLIADYVAFSTRLQSVATKGGLGEPKFYVDGNAFNGPWGRPQNDGPALRSLGFIRYTRYLRTAGNKIFARTLVPTIKTDLEFVAHEWKNPSFDIWEEVKGKHFYTLLVQHRALQEGAKLFQEIGDSGAARYYVEQASEIEDLLRRFWNPDKKILMATIDRVEGVDYKQSNLDSQVILAINHAAGTDSVFDHSDERVLATFEAIESKFASQYEINKRGHDAVVIGRYPEDRYNGYNTGGGGNPWFLATTGMGEFLFRLRDEYRHNKEIRVTKANQRFFNKLLGRSLSEGTYSESSDLFPDILNALQAHARDYLGRAIFHSNGGRMAEQINQDSGFSQGARDLTWSYVSYISAFQRFAH